MQDQIEVHEPVLAVIDLDGVIYNFEEAVAKWIHVSTGRSLETMPTPATQWHYYEQQWDPPLTSDKFWDYVKEGVSNGHIWGCGDPIDGVDTMTAWRAILEHQRANNPNFYAQIVTSRGMSKEMIPVTTALTGAWLNNWGFHYDRLSVVTSPFSKVDEVEQMRTQLLIEPENVFAIDDRHLIAQEYVNAGYTVTLAARPHNAQISGANLKPFIWGRLSFLDWCLRLKLELAEIAENSGARRR